MKKLAILFTSLALTLATVQASASTKINLNDPEIGVTVTENRELLTDGPNLLTLTDTKDGERFYLCSTYKDEICMAARHVKATAYLPPCSVEILNNCISSIYAVDESGKRTEGTFVKFVDLGSAREFPADTTLNLPQGRGHGGIWTLPGVKSPTGGEDYYVGANLISFAGVDIPNNKYAEKFNPTSLIAGISPITAKAGEYGTTVPSDSSQKSNDGSPNGAVGSSNTSRNQDWTECVVTEVGTCYMPQEFPANYRFGLTIKLGKQLQGWFHGRIYQPQIAVTKPDADSQVITIEALPVLVPIVKEKAATASLPSELRTYLTTTEVGNGFGYVMPGSSGEDAFKQMKMWLPVIKDKATKTLTYWSVRTLDYFNDQLIQSCSSKNAGLSGIVTTNSLVYNAGPPDFDKATQNLNYKVLSPHYTSTGDVAKGTYDLILSSKVARCIYGFTSAPVQANLTILSEDGSPQVATQVINEKNGWLTLSAAGFTYSSPTIQVKLTQTAPEPEPTPTPTPTSNKPSWAKGKITITCVKGKLVKKVSNYNPKCPSGYKKKG